MATPESPNLGQHCSVPDCRQIDFIAFICDRCEQSFCIEHRSYGEHNCPEADEQDVTIVICPICAKGFRLVANEDPRITWEDHVRTECDPAATNERKCPVSGCSEILTPSNTVKCMDCGNDHCLTHQLGPDHECPGRPSEAGQSSSSSSRGTPTNTTTETPQWEAVKVRMKYDGSFATITELTDVCPRCDRGFTDIAALIEHLEMEHVDGDN